MSAKTDKLLNYSHLFSDPLYPDTMYIWRLIHYTLLKQRQSCELMTISNVLLFITPFSHFPAVTMSVISFTFLQGVYPKGALESNLPHFKSGGWRNGHFGLHIFDRLLLVVVLGIPVMPRVNTDYLKLVLLYVYVNST